MGILEGLRKTTWRPRCEEELWKGVKESVASVGRDIAEFHPELKVKKQPRGGKGFSSQKIDDPNAFSLIQDTGNKMRDIIQTLPVTLQESIQGRFFRPRSNTPHGYHGRSRMLIPQGH